MADSDNQTSIIEVSDRDVEQKIKDFGELLQSIESLDDKKRALWKEIYTNAIADRQNAYAMFIELFRLSSNRPTSSTDYAVHGKTIATFLERMSRANDQLIKLAELIAKAQSGTDSINADDMFKEINQGR